MSQAASLTPLDNTTWDCALKLVVLEDMHTSPPLFMTFF